MRVVNLETIHRDTVKTVSNLTINQGLLDKRIDYRKNITHKYLKAVEDKWVEMKQVIDILDGGNKTKLISVNEYMEQSLVYYWNLTNVRRPSFSSYSSYLSYSDDFVTASNGLTTGIRYSELFTVWSNISARLVLHLKRYDPTISLQFMEDSNNTSKIPPEKFPKVTYIILSKEDIFGKNEISYIQCKFKETLQNNVTYYETEANNLWYNDAILIDGEMSMKIFIEPQQPQLITNFHFNNGVILWRINDYNKQKQLLISRKMAFIESPYFYTSPRGYKMQILLRFKYEILGYAAAVYCGEYDSELPNMVHYRIHATLYNQEDPTKNIMNSEEYNSRDIKSFTVDDNNWIYFSKSSYLEANSFVKDNSLLLKFTIEPLAPIERLQH